MFEKTFFPSFLNLIEGSCTVLMDRTLCVCQRVGMNTDKSFISEEELLQRARSGDLDASKLLIERYAPMIYKYFRAMELSSGQIDDLMNETFTAFWESIHQFQGRSSLKTWIYGIAHNIRSRHFTEKQKGLRALTKPFIERFKSFYAQNKHKTPEEELIIAESKQLVSIALKSMPISLREILVLRFMEELSLEETANILKIPTGTVKSKTHRAKEVLREKLSRLQQSSGYSINAQHNKIVKSQARRKEILDRSAEHLLNRSGEHLLYANQVAYRKENSGS